MSTVCKCKSHTTNYVNDFGETGSLGGAEDTDREPEPELGEHVT